MEIKINETYQDNNNSPHGFHRFLFPFSSICPDLNFALYVLYIYSCYMKPIQDRNTEPEEIDQSQ